MPAIVVPDIAILPRISEQDPAIANHPWADTAPAVWPHCGVIPTAATASVLGSALNAAKPAMVRRITAVHPQRYTNL